MESIPDNLIEKKYSMEQLRQIATDQINIDNFLLKNIKEHINTEISSNAEETLKFGFVDKII